MIKDIEKKYSVGALLYTPALNYNIAEAVINEKFGNKYSLALCLEDTISSDMVEIAQQQVYETLRQIYNTFQNKKMFLPKIFVRVREPQQIPKIFGMIEEFNEIFTGFILPKYTITNARIYNKEIIQINEKTSKRIFMMPILESGDLVELRIRKEALYMIKDYLDSVQEYVLNVRVGGNDFSNEFAVRRHYDETIYDILPIANLLGDILTVFSREYVVSGPVWEFFSSDNDEWKEGLRKEMKLDLLNGFIGKTVIHPKQIPIINEMLKVTEKDYKDAKTILKWDDSGLQVGKSFKGERMNEVRTNCNWAKKITLLAELYGVK